MINARIARRSRTVISHSAFARSGEVECDGGRMPMEAEAFVTPKRWAFEGGHHASQIRSTAEGRRSGAVRQARRNAQEQTQGCIQVDGVVDERKRARENGLHEAHG